MVFVVGKKGLLTNFAQASSFDLDSSIFFDFNFTMKQVHFYFKFYASSLLCLETFLRTVVYCIILELMMPFERNLF